MTAENVEGESYSAVIDRRYKRDADLLSRRVTAKPATWVANGCTRNEKSLV